MARDKQRGVGRQCGVDAIPKQRPDPRVLEDTYRGRRLPDDYTGRADAFIAAQHILGLGGNVVRHVVGWMAMWASWMPPAEAQALAEAVIVRPKHWKADDLAAELGVTAE